MAEIADAPVKIGVVEFVSPALLKFSFEPVYELIQAVNSKFKRAMVTGFVVLVRGIHKMEYFHSISDIFSTTIDVERIEKATGGEWTVSASSVASSSRERLQISWTKRGLIIEGGSDVETVPLSYAKGAFDLGLEGMDKLGMGFLPGRLVLLLSSESMEKENVMDSFIKRGLKSGKVIVITGNMSPEEFSSNHVDVGKSKKIIFVDWCSHKNEKIIGVDKRENVYMASQDISHLAIAIRKAVDEADEGSFVVMDALTALLKYYDLPAVVSFVMSIAGVLRNKNATTLFTLDGEVFDTEYSSAFTFLLDETIQIKEEREFQGERFIWIPNIRDGYSTGSKAICVIDEKGLRLDTMDKVIKESLGAKGGKISQKMVEALIKDNERLEKELVIAEEKAAEEGSAADSGRIAELEMELARLKEEIFSDAKSLSKVLSVIDEMFEKLPPDVLDEFMNSESFSLYEQMVDKFALSSDFED